MKKRKSKSKIKILLMLFFLIAAGIIVVVNIDNVATFFRHVSKREKSNIFVLIESGHGGINNNFYLTEGKQSPEWEDGIKIYEGYSCKLLAYDLAASLLNEDIDAMLINPGPYNYSNIERALKVNSLLKLDNRIVLISLHHNAQPTDNADYIDNYGLKGFLKGGASGIEIFTSVGQTRSDIIANYIYMELHKEFPELMFRCDWTDGDADKEANFTILTATNCPAVLIEFMFMTTYSDCLIIADKNIRQRYVTALARAFKNYNNFLNLKS